MLRGTLDHPKFMELQDRLDVSRHVAVGLLECLWHMTARYTPDGGVGKWSDRKIARWLEWEGDPGELIAALVESGWLQPDPDCRLYVHDWHVHADDAVHRSLARSVTHFANGQRPKLTRLNAGEPEKLRAAFAAVEAENAAESRRVQTSTDHVRPVGAQSAPDVRSAPPRPASILKTNARRKPKRARVPNGSEGAGTGRAPIPHVTAAELADAARTDLLHAELARRGWVADNPAERIQVHAWANHALREGDNPGAMFADNVRHRRRFADQTDEDAARERVRGLDQATVEHMPSPVLALVDGLMTRTSRLSMKAAPRANEAM